jgi:hypothetical protein
MEDNRRNTYQQEGTSNKRAHAEKVTTDDLKGKKVDADPEKPFDQPIRQLP